MSKVFTVARNEYNEEYNDYMYAGACRLALKLVDVLDNDDRNMKKPQTVKEILMFLAKSKTNMLDYLYHEPTFSMAPIWSKKGNRTAYRPTRLYIDGNRKHIEKYEFISPEEYKWRNTARFFYSVIENAVKTISVLSGRKTDEVFQALLGGEDVEVPDENPPPVRLENRYAYGEKTNFLLSELPFNEPIKPQIICDFFAGSGTTGHAVMALNAEDEGRRKYILVQNAEPCKEGSVAYNSGYRTISDITKERLRRAGKKINTENPNAEFDKGFRAFKVANKENEEQVNKGAFKRWYINNLDDALGYVIGKFGLREDTPIIETEIADGRFYIVGDNEIIMATDKRTTVEQAQEIVKRKPKHIVLINGNNEVNLYIQQYLERHEQERI